jgi:hypothetical protein
MARSCDNQRLAMTLQYVALGSIIIMSGVAATQLLREVFSGRNHDRGRSP